MQYRSLGRTGVMVSPLCVGTMNFGWKTSEADSIRIMDAAFDAGINFFDTADMYAAGESERIVGKWMQDKRDDIVLATKFWNPMGPGPNDRGGSRYYIMKAVEASLKRLNTDHIDLYQIHRPPMELEQDETLRALDDLVRQGKVRYIGTSTYPGWMIVESIFVSEKLGLNRYISEQPPYSLADRRIENTILPVCQRYGLAVLPWSPLAGGLLAGKYPPNEQAAADSRVVELDYLYRDRITPRARLFAQEVAHVAADVGMPLPELALLWVKEQPGITSPIIGPRTMEHLQAALNIIDKTLDADIAARLDELNPPGSAVADFFNTSGWMKMRIPRE
ncbi:MAG: aldo/keto reductase [Chloroflexi bacterium]|nr:MAG: aldo/keto reductase [Chloroflexota bacterium]